LERFADPSKANPDAFRDPDFQVMLNQAQTEYGRSGDDSLRAALVDIVARRSLEKGRTRLALALNEAAVRASNLTDAEFAALAICYFFRYTQRHVGNFTQFKTWLRASVLPFIPRISSENSSFWHIESQGCGSIEMGEISLVDIFRRNYGGLLGSGFTREQLQGVLQEGRKHAADPLVLPCIQDPTKLQPNGLNEDGFAESAQGALDPAEISAIWALFAQSIPDDNGVRALIIGALPESADLFRVWEQTPLKSLK
jgi:hypothetical protein